MNICYSIEMNSGPFTLTYAPNYNTGAIVVATPQPPQIHIPATGIEYFVYRCAPTLEHPMDHWQFIPATTSKVALPDIRDARPLYVFSSTTGQYTPINQIGFTLR